jgi:hypothetical protein
MTSATITGHTMSQSIFGCSRLASAFNSAAIILSIRRSLACREMSGILFLIHHKICWTAARSRGVKPARSASFASGF